MVIRRASIVLAALGLSSCGGTSAPSSKCGPSTATVANVVDGDTIELTDGQKIRYLLVDAPEITKGHNDCYGQEAAKFNTQMVAGQTIELRYDEAGCTDKYGRLLAYVSVGGVEVNARLVERGYACVLYLPPAGDARQIEFKKLESTARSNGAGVWGACNPVTCAQ